MDIFFIIIGIVLLLTALAGCVLPILPGPPVGYLALVLLQFTDKKPFTTHFLIVMAMVVILVTLLDYVIPVWGTKKFGGSKSGTRGATLGLLAGIFILPPYGIIIGPFVGAFLGELLKGNDSQKALKSALGSFLGFLTGTLMKLAITIVMCFYFGKALL